MVLPRGPRVVGLLFNEQVELVRRGVQVLSPSGRRVDAGPVRVSGPVVFVAVNAAEPGTYRVIWRVVASDTHPAQGTFAFSVVRPSLPPGGLPRGPGGVSASGVGLGLQTLARALHLAGYALSVGLFVFRQLVLVPVSLTDDPGAERRVWRLVGAGVLALLLAEPLALVAQTTSLSAGGGGPLDPDLVAGSLDSSFGRVLAQRLGAAILLWVLAGAVRNAHLRDKRAVGIGLILGAAVAAIDGEAAHAVGARPAWLGLALNALHELAMGLWVGGVVGLLAVWPLADRGPRRAQLVARLTPIALASTGTLIATGAAMALQHFTGPVDLTATAYGRTLLTKLAVVGGALLLARTAAHAPLEGRPRWWTREACVLFGVLVLAGLLVSVAPPR